MRGSFLALEVLSSPDVGMLDRGTFGQRLRFRFTVQTVLQDGLDALVRAGLKSQGATASSLQAFFSEGGAQTQDP